MIIIIIIIIIKIIIIIIIIIITFLQDNHPTFWRQVHSNVWSFEKLSSGFYDEVQGLTKKY